MALYREEGDRRRGQAGQLAAVGTDLGEANESAETKATAVVKAAVTDADKKVVVGSNGVITIPAAACSGSVQPDEEFPRRPAGVLRGAFSCEVDVPNPGKYRLTARVVTVHAEGQLQLTANHAKDPIAMIIPVHLRQMGTDQAGGGHAGSGQERAELFEAGKRLHAQGHHPDAGEVGGRSSCRTEQSTTIGLVTGNTFLAGKWCSG